MQFTTINHRSCLEFCCIFGPDVETNYFGTGMRFKHMAVVIFQTSPLRVYRELCNLPLSLFSTIEWKRKGNIASNLETVIQTLIAYTRL